ncbi:MAG TPA: hypothetical protein VF636_02325 [Sphingomonas sp.]|jgi:hypothetical protein
MTAEAERVGGLSARWRLAVWGAAAALMAAPAVAMLFTREMAWGLEDFAFAAVMLGGVGLVFELAGRVSDRLAYLLGVGIGLAAAFLLVWINLAVGIIGSEENPANLLYAGVVAVAAVGAACARLRPAGMARAMVAAAAAQGAVFAVAWAGGLGFTGPITIVFGAMWLASAWAFRRAAGR